MTRHSIPSWTFYPGEKVMKHTVLFRVVIAIVLLTGMIASPINHPAPVKAAGLGVFSATPSGVDAPLDCQIVIMFNQAI